MWFGVCFNRTTNWLAIIPSQWSPLVCRHRKDWPLLKVRDRLSSLTVVLITPSTIVSAVKVHWRVENSNESTKQSFALFMSREVSLKSRWYHILYDSALSVRCNRPTYQTILATILATIAAIISAIISAIILAIISHSCLFRYKGCSRRPRYTVVPQKPLRKYSPHFSGYVQCRWNALKSCSNKLEILSLTRT
jgi:hypothetical protein